MRTRTNKGLYHSLVFRRRLFLAGLLGLLIVGVSYAVTLGIATITVAESYGVILQRVFGIQRWEYSSFTQGVILHLRLPRILLAVITGMSLGSAGLMMQSLLRNPLASPFTLGISSGSAFGAALAIVFREAVFGVAADHTWTTIIGAFAFGLLTILVINAIASLKMGDPSVLILVGVALGYLFSSGVSFLKYVTDHEQLRELTVWLMGGLYRANWLTIIILSPLLMIGLAILCRMAWEVNALASGEEVATSLGVDVHKLRRNGSFVAALLVSCIVAFTGIIGFVGLVAPHVCRMFIGNDNRYLLIASGLMGALILLGADTIARTLITPAELPVGVITSGIGAPFFLWLLIKKRRSYWQ